MPGGVMLATLCLNEEQWLENLYQQHKDWPGLVAWVFVEAADRAYADANPERVRPDGLSIDRTSELIEEMQARDSRVYYVSHGWTGHADPALGKCTARQAYLDIAEKIQPEFVISVDADEFYTYADQARILNVMRSNPESWGFIFPRREIWRPPYYSFQERWKLFSREVVGGFWGIPCCHWWRWQPGMHHRTCHNTPYTAAGVPLNERMFDGRDAVKLGHTIPEMVHLGWAAWPETRKAKNLYYARRGEEVDPKRSWYVESRSAWEGWRKGRPLPHDAKVIPYNGPIPEVFRE